MNTAFQKTVMFLCILLSLCLAGCGNGCSGETTVPAGTTATIMPVETTVPVETAAASVSTEPAETTAPATELPYLQKVTFADQSIYSGPGYDYSFVGIVREAGTYTILEEVWDEEGNLWGKLKSGAGWIDLTQVRLRLEHPPVISANYADDNLILHGDYHYCPGDELEYRIPIAFRAYGTLRDVALFTFEFSGEDYVMGAEFFTLPELTKEMPLVAELAFPGDMSMYGIRFVDEDGITHIYSVYISGRNGALVMTER